MTTTTSAVIYGQLQKPGINSYLTPAKHCSLLLPHAAATFPSEAELDGQA